RPGAACSGTPAPPGAAGRSAGRSPCTGRRARPSPCGAPPAPADTRSGVAAPPCRPPRPRAPPPARPPRRPTGRRPGPAPPWSDRRPAPEAHRRPVRAARRRSGSVARRARRARPYGRPASWRPTLGGRPTVPLHFARPPGGDPVEQAVQAELEALVRGDVGHVPHPGVERVVGHLA